MSTQALSAPCHCCLYNTGGKIKGSHSRAADRCPFVLGHIFSQVTSFMQLGISCGKDIFIGLILMLGDWEIHRTHKGIDESSWTNVIYIYKCHLYIQMPFIYTYTYTHAHTYTHTHTYIYIYICWEATVFYLSDLFHVHLYQMKLINVQIYAT